MKQLQLVGIDVSAKSLTVASQIPDHPVQTRKFPNTPAGHRNLCRRLTKAGRTARVAVEATGVYSLGLAFALDQHSGIEVMVLNPKAAHHFAKASLQRSKTDPLDAAVLLDYVRRMDFVAWKPPRPERLELRSLTRRMGALTKTRAQEKQRLHAAKACHQLTPIVRNDIEVTIRYLQRRIDQLQAKAIELIKAHPELQQALARITSVKGIAETSGVQILAELAILPQDLTPRQWVAHAGLDPRHTTSGTSVAKPARISKAGNTHLRRALYMPALVAVQFEPRVRAFYDKLLARGKRPLQALAAVMRKLLHSIYGMILHDTIFDGEKFYASNTAEA